MELDFDRLNREDREYWNEVYSRTSGGTPSPTTTAVVPKRGGDDGDGGDADFDREAPKTERRRPPRLSRNQRDRLWSAAGALVGGLIAGGTGAAIGSYLASPRKRMNAQKRELSNTSPLRTRPEYNDRLTEPYDKHKDQEKTFSQRLFDKTAELQVGKGTGDYKDDYTRNRNLGKWIDDDEFGESVQRRTVEAVVTEALKSLRNR